MTRYPAPKKKTKKAEDAVSKSKSNLSLTDAEMAAYLNSESTTKSTFQKGAVALDPRFLSAALTKVINKTNQQVFSNGSTSSAPILP